MTQKILFVFSLALFWAFLPLFVSAAVEMPDKPDSAAETVDLSQEIDLSQVKEILKQLDQEVQDSLPGFSFWQIFEDMKNSHFNLNSDQIRNSILKIIINGLVVNAPLMVKLLILAVLCAVINQLRPTFSGEVSRMAGMLIYLVLLGIALASFQVAMGIGTEAIDKMVSFMQVTLPLLYTVLLALGNIASVAIFKPVVMGSLVFLASVMKNVVLPLFFFTIVLKLFNNISKQFKLSKLASLMEFGGKFSMGLVMTIFLGIMSVQGVTGGVADGVTLRTAKYSADLIPVAGKFFKDAVELVAGSGLLLKNALGVVSLLAIVLITLVPVLKIVAMMLTFKISAALVEPLGEVELAESLQDLAKGLLYISLIITSVGIMFFMTITIIIGTGNLAVMLG